MSGLSI